MARAAATPTTTSIEGHAKPASAGLNLPSPDTPVAEDITPGKRGGQLTYVVFGEGPKTFDPITLNDSSSFDIVGRLQEGLVRFDAMSQSYSPGLLKDYYMEADKSVWTLRLRSGLKWSDGQPLTADDIVFTAKVIYDPKIVNPSSSVIRVADKPIEFEKVDDLTVRAKLAKPSGSFHVMLASFPLVPKHALEEAYNAGKYDTAWNIDVDPKKVVCSGPFMVKQYVSGERVVLERNPNYYKYDSKGTQLPYLDNVIFGYVPDQDAMLLRFQRGESDVLFLPRPEAIPDLEAKQKEGNYTLYDCGPTNASGQLWFNLKRGNNPNGKPYVAPAKQEWFNNETFRKACYHALNKDAIINTVMRGKAVSLWSLESPALTLWYNPNVTKYPYDAAKAKQMLESIGMIDRNGDGIREDTSGTKVSFTFITNKGNKLREDVANLFSADLKAVGVEANPQFIDFNALVTATGDTLEYEACLLAFGGSTHPSTSMNNWRTSGRTHFINPSQKTPATPWEAEIDKLCDDFTAALDFPQQQKIYFKMQEIYADHCGSLPTYTGVQFQCVRNTFGNIKPTSLGDNAIWNSEEIYHK